VAALLAPCWLRIRTTCSSAIPGAVAAAELGALLRHRSDGADVYSRLLFGARITILIGVIAVGARLIVGVPVGLVAGYYHGLVQ